MTDTLLTILQWLIPAGGLGTVIAWLFSCRIRRAKADKDIHDTYKSMYEDVQLTLKEIRDENSKLHKAVSRLERAILRASLCRYYDDCPVRHELCEPEDDAKSKNRN